MSARTFSQQLLLRIEEPAEEEEAELEPECEEGTGGPLSCDNAPPLCSAQR